MDVYFNGTHEAAQDAGRFIEEKLIEQQTFGYVKPYLPVLEQAVVRKVWITNQPDEHDPQVLVTGHWTYVMIEGPKWYREDAIVMGTDEMIPREPVQIKEDKKNGH